jgi:microcystin-dependent protein
MASPPQPYVGEIYLMACNFAINGFALCNGQLMPISENETLFNLIGTTYGGDGEETFGLPNLQGRVPVHMGQGPGGDGHSYVVGEAAGMETVTLTESQIPIHAHQVLASSAPGNASSPAGTIFAASSANQYVPSSNTTGTTGSLGSTVSTEGGSQAHNNLQPYLAITFQISLFGVFPTP